jgi:hypothetical protein
VLEGVSQLFTSLYFLPVQVNILTNHITLKLFSKTRDFLVFQFFVILKQSRSLDLILGNGRGIVHTILVGNWFLSRQATYFRTP